MIYSSEKGRDPTQSYDKTPIPLEIKTSRDKTESLWFNITYRYIDDVLSINNLEFENYLGQMYSAELEIKDTTESITSAFYLNLVLSTSHFHLRQTR